MRYVSEHPCDDAKITELAEALHLHPLTAKLLVNRGYTTPEEATAFIRNEATLLHDPFLLNDMQKAIDRINRSLKNSERIVIYGDYDVDGVTAVSTLYLYLQDLGADIHYYIPSRSKEGYGLSCAAIERLAADGTKLIITVDTGITAAEEVDYAASIGVDMVITDHHECRPTLPSACAVVNPRRADSTYPFDELAGVGVVFKLICALELTRARAEGRADIDAIRHICYTYADLTAVGTIADVMPLRDENRLIVSLGLRLASERKRVGLTALIDAASSGNPDVRPATATTNPAKPIIKRKKITSGFIGFSIAPRINAAGRISEASRAVELFLTDNPDQAAELAYELCDINRRRQIEENRIAEQAYEMIEKTHDFTRDRVIVLSDNDWQQGIIGIVSSRITEKYGLPSILISFDGVQGLYESPDDPGKGSGRSVKGLNLVHALTACDDLLLKFGGHELAAGLTVSRGNLDAFRERINDYAREHLNPEDMKTTLEAECEVCMDELTLDQASELYLLEPYGISNPVPAFVLHDVELVRITAIGGGKHTRLSVKQGKTTLTAMCFGSPTAHFPYSEGDHVDLLFNLDINEYQNTKSVQLIVRDLHHTEGYIDEQTRLQDRYEEICAGGEYTAEEDIYPEREDFAQVYTTIRREYRLGHDVFTLRTLGIVIKQMSGQNINPIKLKFIVRVLQEMQILGIEELAPDRYQFELFFHTGKINLEKSSILRKLKTQCSNRPK
ncbi:MAG: DHH family phosphoesterase [Clostridia bacterium]|nr:DHH family phosphoesterase [Clostridia bacterium]